jgi:undecaprenyl-diphosphatase
VPILHAIVLGIVQGLSEFLPISSSGHLILVRWLFGWDELSGDTATAFDVAVHVGTLMGAAAYLRRDIANYVAAALSPVFGRGPLGPDGRAAWSLAVSAVPAGAVGVFAGDALRGSGGAVPVAVALIIFGLLLGASDRLAEGSEVRDFGIGHALAMGAGQALALQPGVSRSGVTMTVARVLGYSREAAVRLAFLMSLPVIAGAGVYGLLELSVPSSLWPALVWGMVSSGLTGWAAVWGTTQIVSRVGLQPFVVYRVLVGAAVLALLATPWR